MIKIKEAIVVEGRYDRNKLAQLVDAPILETSGFGIFKNREQLDLLCRVAEKRGLIILTDSDGAGFVIRNYIKSAIPGKYLKHAYIPEISGKEKRKTSPGKEGILGVEGIAPNLILEALKRAGATIEGEDVPTATQLTKQDMMELGLSGGDNSSFRRQKLLDQLHLPRHMSTNALLQALQLLYTKEELMTILQVL